jgi:hypothetical protein
MRLGQVSVSCGPDSDIGKWAGLDCAERNTGAGGRDDPNQEVAGQDLATKRRISQALCRSHGRCSGKASERKMAVSVGRDFTASKASCLNLRTSLSFWGITNPVKLTRFAHACELRSSEGSVT